MKVEEKKVRLDQAVAAQHPDVSRRKAKDLIAAHRVLVNDRPIGVASRMIAPSDRITIVDELPQLMVIRKTKEWIAVDKPSGLPVQPVRERDRRSLEELLRIQLKREGLPSEIYVVHRLDTGTSGVIVFARTRAGAARLSALFASGEIRKIYYAVAGGVIEGEARIDTPIGQTGQSEYGVTDDGKTALTIVRPRATGKDATLVEAEIMTGRTHQIRVHLSSIGHPVAGDRKYGRGALKAPRLMLHAAQLQHESLGTITALLPDDFREFCAARGISLPV